MIGLMLFDFQMICTSEVSLFDYSRLPEFEARYKMSLFMSLVLIVLIFSQLLEAYKQIRENMRKSKHCRGGSDQGLEFFSNTNQMILNIYVDGLNVKFSGIHN